MPKAPQKSRGLAKPLQGLRVIEFTHMVMGPTTGVILADLGADVIKVEPLTGDSTRHLKGSGAGYFPMYNRNKRSIRLDLKTTQGLDIADRLIGSADILIENFRPGTMGKLNLGYESLAKKYPRLIYCSLKGFLSGPYENRVALDEVVQMMGGLAYMTGLPDKPMRAGSSVIDIAGGMFGVIGILAAVEERHRTGLGKYVTSALFETTAFLVGQHMAQERVSGEAPPPMSVRRSAWAIYDIFTIKNDDKLFVGIVSDALWQRFCKEFGLSEWAADQRLASNQGRVDARDWLLPAVSELFSHFDKSSLSMRLERAGLPFAPINRPSDLFEDDHLKQGNGLLSVTLTDGLGAGSKAELPALPLEFDQERTGLYRDLPASGADVESILCELGVSAEEYMRQQDARAVD
jgi:crotonobetainyl-CoA:carnitine CoA-transferase CaiB-like acyl-CoA transferase